MDVPGALTLAVSVWLTLPHGDTAWDLVETTVPFAFADRMNTGGTLTGSPPLVGADASSWRQATYRIGLLDITDLARGGAPLVYPDLSMVEQVRVSPGGAPAGTAAPGPDIGLGLRQGGDRWRRTLATVVAPAAWQPSAPESPPASDRLRSLGRFEATAGGPFPSSDRQLYLAGAVTRSTHLERDEGIALPGDAWSLFVHAVSQHSRWEQGYVGVWIQGTRRPFGGRARFADRAVPERDRFDGVVFGWKPPARVPIEIDGGLQTIDASVDVTSATPNGTVDRLRDGPIQELAAASAGTHRRWSLAAQATPLATPRHTVRGAATISRASATAAPLGTGLIGERVNGLPARAWNYGFAGTVDRSETILGGYVSDTVALGPALSLDAGVRVEHVGGAGGGGASRIAWTTATPMIGIQYAPGNWTFGASARRYYDQLALETLAFGDPAGPQGDVFHWTDANNNGRVDPGEAGTLIARVGPGASVNGLSSIDQALRRPHTDEAVISAEWRFRAHWALRARGVARQQRDLLGAVNVGVPASAYVVTQTFDPGGDLLSPADDQLLPIYRRPPETFGLDRYLLTNPAAAIATEQAVHLAVVTSDAGRWYLLAGATALRSRGPAAYRGFGPDENDQGAPGDAFSDPNSTTYATGRLFFDRSYGIKVAASYRAPGDVTLGSVARYADGQNFARLVLVPDLPQGPDVIRAYANGRSKFTYTLTLDLRAAKAFRWRVANLTAAFEAFNALNTRNEVEEDTVTGAGWRTATAVQPPRVLRLALRVEF